MKIKNMDGKQLDLKFNLFKNFKTAYELFKKVKKTDHMHRNKIMIVQVDLIL